MKTKIIDGKCYNITIVPPSEINNYLTSDDIEMDYRVKEAVKAAIHKAKVCKKPIAKYDADTRQAYIEYPDGRKEYV